MAFVEGFHEEVPRGGGVRGDSGDGSSRRAGAGSAAELRPDASSVLGLQFVLRADGRTDTISGPEAADPGTAMDMSNIIRYSIGRRMRSTESRSS
jgi:hypothetical protein